ncbi:hypothetical protein [Leptolyngbya sp. FACHB-17]|uniref:hypothetical protein n=1 Tax=unclassified Leptolyngbya TaxID=2650499 RepID=UPI0016801BDA|nr:hypothetical protein [Leptolyngbya sp. FACHB-17]MBD2080934.1 hypothetical protein [Leptolyngbya sp. FACHB-17]
MKLQLLIDRIILEGKSLPPSQRRRLYADIEAELTALLTMNGIPNRLQSAGTLANLSIELDGISELPGTRIGQAIAHAIYRELNR